MAMKLTPSQVKHDISLLSPNYKTADVDRLIKKYIKEKADISALRPHILVQQEFHRIYYFVPLKQMKSVDERMEFIHNNLLFSDWWHTDQLIGFVADLDFDKAFAYAKDYVMNDDPFIRRWGYVLFISKLGRDRAKELLAFTHNDEHYTVQMAQAWLIAELTVFEPDYVYAWLKKCDLKYSITGKAIQKICDSYRISREWKEKFKGLREGLKAQ